MTLETDRKILIDTVLNYHPTRIYTGDCDSNLISLISIIIKYKEFLLNQHNGYLAGINYKHIDPEIANDDCINKQTKHFLNEIKHLNKLMFDIKYNCDSVPNYKEQLIITDTSNREPSTIEDNVIDLNYSDEYQSLNYNDIVYNYFSLKSRLISSIIFSEIKSNIDVLYNNNIPVIETEYSVSTDIKVKYNYGRTKKAYIKNIDYEECKAYLTTVDTSLIPRNSLVLDITQDGKITYQNYTNNEFIYTTIQGKNEGSIVYTDFSLKVKNNYSNCFICSNTAKISFRFKVDCTKPPILNGDTNIVEISTINTTKLNVDDFDLNISDFSPLDFENEDFETFLIETDRIKITSLEITDGYLKYYNTNIVSLQKDFIIKVDDILNEKLIFISDNTNAKLKLTYKIANKDDINFSKEENTILIQKLLTDFSSKDFSPKDFKTV